MSEQRFYVNIFIVCLLGSFFSAKAMGDRLISVDFEVFGKVQGKLINITTV